MIKKLFLLLVIIFATTLLWSQEKAITQGLKITKSVKFKKGIYKINAPASGSGSVIIIEGKNIVVDFNLLELKGSNNKKKPDEYYGIAILIRKGKNITIKNLKARGYKFAILARNTEGLILENCDLSYNYRQHLNSSQEKEDISDWMSYHHNEKNEWLRYGAAIYLENCNKATVKNCKVTGGQNALMMTRCNYGKIFNNDFTFNSGIGIGMYRCSANEVSYNRLNFNVRGYSHGVYNRGQDSAGILVYEQSNYNIFYKNSATHCGDGFFLWAGQSTMDTGEGGCNDNVIIENDFSYAPTNGVEVTFSRNRISGNRIFQCDHGIWGGYSYASMITDNKFRNNRVAIAIEHGQNNEISYNIFLEDKEAIRLWSRKQQPSDWGYAKYRDTRSVGYTIAGNSFNNNPTVYNISGTDSIEIFSNTYSGFDQIFKIDSTVKNIDSTERDLVDSTLIYPQVKNPVSPFLENGKYAGKKNIIITEWGPYDFRYPLIWNTNPVDSGNIMNFDLLGPGGNWVIKNFKGVNNISATNGSFPATVSAEKIAGAKTDIVIELEYTGPGMVTPFGDVIKSGKPYPFFFKKFFQPLNWEVLFYSLDTAVHNPITTNMLFSPLERKAPFKTEKINKLDYAWWGGIKDGGYQHKQFITIAEATAELEAGQYEISVTWDDAVRVYVDSKMVIDEWNPSKYTFDESPNKRIKVHLNGLHHFRVEHLELGGFATLSLKLKPAE
ncbi:MAG TPA: right-handed parallel beta-helix repeat-containing protein [Chitinophagaceae bacterium]|nr:right-handed parallel beta-helix repeat-containing protein [Chitinophagaceae bacterium]